MTDGRLNFIMRSIDNFELSRRCKIVISSVNSR